jgi:hypothetical protein
VVPTGRAELRAQDSSGASAASPRHSPSATNALARPEPTEIDATGRRYAGAVRNCYEQEGLMHDPMLRGLLRVALTVLPAGEVRATRVTAARAERVVLWCDLVPRNRWRVRITRHARSPSAQHWQDRQGSAPAIQRWEMLHLGCMGTAASVADYRT